jgi:hypothetical protein
VSKLHILTIALDANIFLHHQLYTFNRLDVDWTWYVVEGSSMNSGSTSWCNPQPPRLSRDGTTEFLNQIRNHPRIVVIQRQSWKSKDEMVNAALDRIGDAGVLVQVDADEIWLPGQLSDIFNILQGNEYSSAQFFCRYFIGQNIVITSENGYGNRPEEWLRAWKFRPGMRFSSHEPPVLLGNLRLPKLGRVETRDMGLVFDHYAYSTAEQLKYKEKFYGYKDALSKWNLLQCNQAWPVNDLKKFLPWVGDGVTADLLHR